MVRTALALGMALGFGALAREPCGPVDSSSGGVNAPCTRDRDCSGSLLCRQGACAEEDASTGDSDAGDGSATSPADAAHE